MTIPSYKPFIVEDEDCKTLYFNSFQIQSEMNKHAPNQLSLGYTQAMMAFLLLQPAPKEIFILGLGGGSLSKYCYLQFPDARITTIEINTDVIALRNTFLIPEDNERFQIIHADGAEYLKNKNNIADVILLDAYDDQGIPEKLIAAAFYKQCYEALKAGGVLVANFNCDDLMFENCITKIGNAFNSKVLIANSVTSYNEIAFAMKNAEIPALKTLQERAELLKEQTKLNFPRFMNQMWSSYKAQMLKEKGL